jgi:hypothetical protein
MSWAKMACYLYILSCCQNHHISFFAHSHRICVLRLQFNCNWGLNDEVILLSDSIVRKRSTLELN